MLTEIINLMKSFALYTLVGFLLTVVVGCQDLAVENENNPDREIAFSQPGDVVNLLRGTFSDYWHSVQSCENGALTLSTMADENSSSWANWSMQDMSSEPRVAWNNNPNYVDRAPVEESWFDNYRGISNVNDALQAIARAEEEGSVDDNIFTQDGHDTNQLKAFAKMNQGLMHGSLSLFFDQGFIFDENVNLETDKLELRPYDEIHQAAIQMLEQARDIAASNTFTLNDWIWGLNLNSADVVRLINSFIVRFTIQVARDPDERAAVNWSNILDLIDAGITQDFAPVATAGIYDTKEDDCLKFYANQETWARADYRTIGPADESGGYQAWLATPLQDRSVFDIVTSDRRIVGAENDPTVSGTDFEYLGVPGPFPPARGTYHYSSHLHKRYWYYLLGARKGPMPHLTLAELNMYKAEALLRTGGSTAEVAALINRTRVRRGRMNPASGSDPVGSYTDDQSHLDSASLWAKLKHERRIETMNTAGGLAFYDDRGIGDLVTGTAIHFPVPGTELETLGLQNYTFGGVGGVGAAPTAYREAPDNYRPR